MTIYRNRANQAGFTVAELIIVVIIIAILAAVAVPRYAAFDSKANADALTATAGNIASASEINLSSAKMGGTFTPVTVGTSCASVVSGILSGGLPSGYTTSGNIASTSDTLVGTCAISQTSTGNAATVNILLTA